MTQKMVKRGFRGERKGILTPSLSQGEGECGDEEAKETSPFTHTQLSLATFKGGMWRIIYSVSPRTPEGGQAGKGDKHLSLHILCSCEAHTQLSLATFKGGIWRRKGEGIIRN